MFQDAALPRGDAEDCEVYHKNDDKESSVVIEPSEIEKDTLSCYTTTACNTDTDLVVVQALPMLVTVPGGKDEGSQALDVSCGSRHTVVLTKANVLWAFGWNKYGQVSHCVKIIEFYSFSKKFREINFFYFFL